MGYKKGEVLKTAFDRFVVVGQKGSGGSGEVYEVTDSDGKPFAIKVLDASKTTIARLKRFENETYFCLKKTHQNIIQVLSYGVTEKGASFYVMPLYSCTLRDLMKKRITTDAVLPLFGQILDGVEAAHLQNVWHRDVKPENILYSAEENRLVVADFGIAHFEEEDLLTAVKTNDQERLANFHYAAPEQKSGGKVGSKADVYALGLICNEMFTGRVPEGTSFRKISEATPEFAYIDEIVDSMLRQDPDARPSIEEVKRTLVARGNEFVSMQRLNAAKSQVIRETEVDDPIVNDPIRIVGVEYRPTCSGGNLVFKLSRTPTPMWMQAFRSPNSNWSGILGLGPDTFGFSGNEAHVELGRGIDPQLMTNHAKNYVELANRQYSETVIAQNRRNLIAQKEQQRKRIEQEEETQKLLARVSQIKL